MSLIPSESLNFPDSFRVILAREQANKNRRSLLNRPGSGSTPKPEIEKSQFAKGDDYVAALAMPALVQAELDAILDLGPEQKPAKQLAIAETAANLAPPAEPENPPELQSSFPAVEIAPTKRPDPIAVSPTGAGESEKAESFTADTAGGPPSTEEILARIFGLKAAWAAEANGQPPPNDIPRITPVPAPVSEKTESPRASRSPKAPARIRIVPRKLKPREPLPEDGPENVADEETISHRSPNHVGPSPIDPVLTEMAGSKKRKTEIIRPDNDPRKIVAPRFERIRPEPVLHLEGDDPKRWLRFLFAEIGALACFLVLLRFGVTRRFADQTFTIMIDIVITAAAVAMIAIPVVFWRNSPARWRVRR